MSEYVETQSEVMDWDSEISVDGKEFILLPEGDYVFTVVDFQRGYFNGSAKVPACPKAILTLELETKEGAVRMTENLLLIRSMEWKQSAFFRSIGQKKHGETLKPNWNKVLNSQGMVHVKPREYIGNDGQQKKTNSVDYFIDYNPEMIRNILQRKVDEIEEEIPF